MSDVLTHFCEIKIDKRDMREMRHNEMVQEDKLVYLLSNLTPSVTF